MLVIIILIIEFVIREYRIKHHICSYVATYLYFMYVCVSVCILYAYIALCIQCYTHTYMHTCIHTHKVDQTLHGDGPTAVQSNLGYLLSGLTTSTQTVDKTLQMFHTVVQQIEESNINNCWDVESTNTLSNTELSSNSQFLTSYLKFSVECQSVRWLLYKQKGPMEGKSPFSPFQSTCM